MVHDLTCVCAPSSTLREETESSSTWHSPRFFLSGRFAETNEITGLLKGALGARGDGGRESQVLGPGPGPGSDTLTLAHWMTSGRSLHLSGPRCLEGVLLPSDSIILWAWSQPETLDVASMPGLLSPGCPAGERLPPRSGSTRAALRLCRRPEGGAVFGAALPSPAAPPCPVPTAFCPACLRHHPPGCLSLFPVTRFSAETASGCRAPGRCWASTCACPGSSSSTSQAGQPSRKPFGCPGPGVTLLPRSLGERQMQNRIQFQGVF